ncbi:hypothetical protein [Pseudomonas sp. TWP3-1]|uniref:hypothetical protein n=1 Tax=Pseudomonas sp. TWP3-1 TaxID=2804631 RepID=UPI003CF05DC3
MVNLVQNGDFAQQDEYWKTSNPQDVSYPGEHCEIAPPSSISQDVLIDNATNLMLSARMKTDQGFAGSVSLQPHPTGPVTNLDVGGSQAWTIKFAAITVPAGTIKVTVKLEANDGAFGTKGAYFSDVALVQLP